MLDFLKEPRGRCVGLCIQAEAFSFRIKDMAQAMRQSERWEEALDLATRGCVGSEVSKMMGFLRPWSEI